MTEKYKIINALPYRTNDAELVKLRREVRVKLATYNQSTVPDAAEAVIGAGSVVTRDIPPGVFAAGNPCRVIKNIKQ